MTAAEIIDQTYANDPAYAAGLERERRWVRLFLHEVIVVGWWAGFLAVRAGYHRERVMQRGFLGWFRALNANYQRGRHLARQEAATIVPLGASAWELGVTVDPSVN